MNGSSSPTSISPGTSGTTTPITSPTPPELTTSPIIAPTIPPPSANSERKPPKRLQQLSRTSTAEKIKTLEAENKRLESPFLDKLDTKSGKKIQQYEEELSPKTLPVRRSGSIDESLYDKDRAGRRPRKSDNEAVVDEDGRRPTVIAIPMDITTDKAPKKKGKS